MILSIINLVLVFVILVFIALASYQVWKDHKHFELRLSTLQKQQKDNKQAIQKQLVSQGSSIKAVETKALSEAQNIKTTMSTETGNIKKETGDLKKAFTDFQTSTKKETDKLKKSFADFTASAKIGSSPPGDFSLMDLSEFKDINPAVKTAYKKYLKDKVIATLVNGFNNTVKGDKIDVFLQQNDAQISTFIDKFVQELSQRTGGSVMRPDDLANLQKALSQPDVLAKSIFGEVLPTIPKT
jgi:DNA-binding ferritin-like protein (Dps family)